MNAKEVSLKEKVYNGILELVGSYAPGTIITEKQMIETFKVSKSPVREAMLELCKDNVLSSIPRCGYQVNQVSIKTLHEITQMRLLLEIPAFMGVANKLDAKLIDQTFKSIVDKRKNEKCSVWQANENNTDFHMALVNLSGNALLCQFLKKVLDLYSRAYAQVYLTVPQIIQPTSNPTHESFIEAWKNGDFEKAKDYLQKDIIMAEEGLQFVTNGPMK